MSMHHSPLDKARSLVIFLCLVLIIGLVAYAYFTDNNNSVLTKEQIEENLNSDKTIDLGDSYVSSYIKKYGIGNINSHKINLIENYIESYFYKPLPSERDTAKKVCELYLEYFYDTTDINDKEAVTDAVIHCLIASLEDPYAYYRTADEYAEYLSSLKGGDSFVGIGVMVNSKTLQILMVYKGSGAEAAGIRRGDFIYAVDGVTIDETSAEALTEKLRGKEGSTVNVQVKRGGNIITDLPPVERKALTEQTVSYEIDDNNVGYIYVTQFLETTVNDFKEAVDYCVNNKAVALVIDMRYNPGGLVTSVVSMVDYLIPDANDRMITSYPQSGQMNIDYTVDGHGVNIPIAVICNESTASAGELFTASMRDFADAEVIKAVVVGKNTFGKGIVQSSFSYYDNSGVTFTIGYYNPPCDVNFDGIGVAPDIVVEEVDDKDAPFEVAKEEVMKLVYSINGTVGIYAPAA